ncbi:NusA-like transcription termination signal-binding factor [Candidatus Micrarchaeota archaeon]|nr:NusA-like transcription termination signal-binding factor [Candidatus Micrarchaeota archaeon]
MTKLSMEDIQKMNAMEQITGAKAQDVVDLPDRIIFIVPKQDLGKAIGKGGSNVSRLKQGLGKPVEIVEAADEEKAFFAALFKPAVVDDYSVNENDGKRSLDVRVQNKERGIAIGRNGEKIKRAKLLGKRYYGYEDVRIVTRG